jgi:UDP-N-acetylmuramate dehydrogenase
MVDFSKLKGKIYRNHPLAKYTSWNIGGPAEYFYKPTDLDDLVQVMLAWQDEPITILGAGTNILIRENGIKGLVIYLCNSFNRVREIEDCCLHVEAGAMLRDLVQKCIEFGMEDAAFLAGIPGTVGGALKMNAGAYGDFIWNYVVAVETINRLGEIKFRKADEFVPGYRHIKGLDKDEWIVASKINFERGDTKIIKEQVENYLQKRSKSQPLDLSSCGSVFRNPEGDYAARLISISGLQGRQIGGARISEKHANFIVNCGGATSHDVEKIMQEIIEAIEKEHGITLIPEVHILGDV